MSGETDADLLIYISMNADDPQIAENAFAEFYVRHYKYLYHVLSKQCASTYGKSSVEDLVQDTFMRVWDRASTFSRDNINDPERLRKRVRAWLAKIATRLLIDALRKTAPEQLSSELDLIMEGVTYNHPKTPEKQAQIDALSEELNNVLTEREKFILAKTYEYYDATKKHQRLPNAVSSELAAALRTTTANIRQIRKRARQKVEQYLYEQNTTQK